MSKRDVVTPAREIQYEATAEAKSTLDDKAFDAAVMRAVKRSKAKEEARLLAKEKQPEPREIGAVAKDYSKDALRCARQFIADKTLPADIKHPRNVFTFAHGTVPRQILAAFKLSDFSSWSDVGRAIERAQAKPVEHEIPHGWSEGRHPRSNITK